MTCKRGTLWKYIAINKKQIKNKEPRTFCKPLKITAERNESIQSYCFASL